MICNNFKTLDELFKFIDTQDYYIIDVIQERENNNPKIIKTFYIYENKEIPKYEIINLCKEYNAIAIAYLQARNSRVTAKECFGCLADILLNGDYFKGEHIWHDTSVLFPSPEHEEIYTFEVNKKELPIIYKLLGDKVIAIIPYNEDVLTVICKEFEIGKFQTKLLLNNLHRKLIYKNDPVIIYKQ